MLRICKSLATQTYTAYELVIVDSSDTDKITQAEIEELGNIKNETRIIYSEPGLTRQRNIGIEEAKGELYFFFDDDLILENDFVEEMVKVFEENPQYYGGMGAFSNVPDRTFKDKIYNGILKFFLLRNSNGNGKFQKSGFPNFPHGREVLLETEVSIGGITAYRKEVFDNLKFDEYFSDYSYMEDLDFSRRVSKKYKLFYNPKARAEHRHASGGRGNYFENRRMYIFNHRYLFEKNFPQKISYKLAHMWSIVGLYVFALWSMNTAMTTIKAYTAGLRDYGKSKSA